MKVIASFWLQILPSKVATCNMRWEAFSFQIKVILTIELLCLLCTILDPIVQSIVSLTSSLRGQLVKSFTTLLSNTLNSFVEKMREAFAQSCSTFCQQQILAYLRYKRLKF